MQIEREQIVDFLRAVANTGRGSGFTHDFYKYPARFSPSFARVAIETFSSVGDVVLDPFMGGGTTLVEARTLGRIGIGSDISELSCFIARSKTTLLSGRDEKAILSWFQETVSRTNLHGETERPQFWIERGYQRNLNTKPAWRIRKSIELVLQHLSLLPKRVQRDFSRAVVLRTGQWAFESRRKVPSVAEFRKKLVEFATLMIEGEREFRTAIRKVDKNYAHLPERNPTVILNCSAVELADNPKIREYRSPKLILTSPPYPGIHVLYHRWQVDGRRETPAPFWIANALDGNGTSFYTFGDRKDPKLTRYFDTAIDSFRSLATLATPQTLVVQLVSFSDVTWQLPRYLECMESAGLTEVEVTSGSGHDITRIWREVPNRKWYANRRSTGGSKEVVLFHRLAT